MLRMNINKNDIYINWELGNNFRDLGKNEDAI